MRKYPKYKASGVDWLGEIPNEWNTIKIKFTDTLIMGQSPESKDVTDFEKGLPFLQGNAEFTDTHPIPKNWCEKSNKIAIKDDLLLSVRAPVGALNVSDQTYGIGRGLCAIRTKKNNLRFLYYLLSISKEELNKVSTGTTFVAITIPNLSNLVIPKVNLPEQHAIVRFLDYKTGQIDSFIANRQKQIELLKEQKAGIINKAVTKGINPNAKMKDSGIEWVGEVPEHWMIGKVRRVLNILTDFTANGSFADLAKNVKYLDTPDHSRLIRLTDLREDLKNEGIYVNKEAHKFLSKSELFGGEILMANVGAYAGLVCLVPKLDFIATLGPNMFLLKFDEKRMSNQFAFTLLGSDCYYKLLMNKALSSAQPKLNKEDVKSIDFIFPPTQEEQKAILDWIKEETSNVDTLISKYQKQIDLMQEYRTSLISQAVTGKIDVREWQPKKQETA